MMKRSSSSSSLALFLWVVSIVVAIIDGPVVVHAAAADLSTAQRAFADQLVSNLYSSSSDQKNECTSSLGVSMVFDLIYPAAAGESQIQLQNVFGFAAEQPTKLQWTPTAAALQDIYQGQCLFGLEIPTSAADVVETQQETTATTNKCQQGPEPAVRIANRIWIRDTGVSLNPEYAAVVGSLATQLDFDDAGAGAVLNQWVQDETAGLIDSIVEDGKLPENWILVAINTIYVKAAWHRTFLEQLTTQDAFYATPLRSNDDDSSEPTEQARFMHQVQNYEYLQTAEHQILRLPFAGDDAATERLSMIFVLPIHHHADDMNTSSSSSMMMTATRLASQLPHLQTTRVAVALPKFRFESKYDDSLKAALQATGLIAPFLGELCITNVCDAAVDHVVQKTVIDVNEQGVEAAAATLLSLDRSSPPAQAIFLANHPFGFFIHDANQDVFLFEGVVVNPGIGNNEPDASTLLQESHQDANFWRSYLSADLNLLPTSSPSRGNNNEDDDENQNDVPADDTAGMTTNGDESSSTTGQGDPPSDEDIDDESDGDDDGSSAGSLSIAQIATFLVSLLLVVIVI